MKNHGALFFSSIAAFSLLIFLSPVVSTLLLGMQLQIVFAAPLMATAIVSIFFYLRSKWFDQVSVRVLTLFFYLLPISTLVSFYLLTRIQHSYDLALFAVAKKVPADLVEQLLDKPLVAHFSVLTLAIISLPFIIYGLILGSLFSRVVDKVALYKTEMLGALIGSFLIEWILEWMNYSLTLIFILSMSLLGLLLFGGFRKKVLWVFAALIVGLSVLSPNHFEPQRDFHLIARDFHKQFDIQLIAKNWNIYSKVQTLKLSRSGESHQVIALGDGTGIARLRQFSETGSVSTLFARVLKSLKPQARDVAVLFAGAGSDMLDLDRAYQGQAQITGVELNRQLISQAKTNAESKMADFIARPNIHFLDKEARNFLEHSSQTFDGLIYSWSGATVAHYSGAIMHTTQYAFTLEALEKAVEMTNPEGFLLIAGGSKVNLLLNFQRLQAQNKIQNLASSYMLLSWPESKEKDVFKSWDNVILIWKKGLLSEDEVARVKKELQDPHDYQVVDSPFESSSGPYRKIRELVESNADQDLLQSLRNTYQVHFDVFSDNRPFVYNSADPGLVTSGDFWAYQAKDIFKEGPFENAWSLFLGCLMVSFLMFLQTVVSKKNRGDLKFSFLAYLCGWVGAGFTILTLYLLLFYIEQPASVLQLGLALGFLGSVMACSFSFNYRILKVIFTSLVVLGIVTFIKNYYVSSPTIVFLLIILAFGFSWVFPLLLKISSAENSRGSFFAVFAFDSLGALCATLFMPLLIENLGFQVASGFLIILMMATLAFAVFKLIAATVIKSR